MKTESDLICDHIGQALWLAHRMTVSPSQRLLVDTLVGALQEVSVLFPLALEREDRARAS